MLRIQELMLREGPCWPPTASVGAGSVVSPPLHGRGSRRNPQVLQPHDFCACQWGIAGGAQHRLCRVLLGCVPEFHQEEAPDKPQMKKQF